MGGIITSFTMDDDATQTSSETPTPAEPESGHKIQECWEDDDGDKSEKMHGDNEKSITQSLSPLRRVTRSCAFIAQSTPSAKDEKHPKINEPSKFENKGSGSDKKRSSRTFDSPPLRKVTRKKPSKQQQQQNGSNRKRRSSKSVTPGKQVDVIEIDLDNIDDDDDKESADENDTKDGGGMNHPQHEEKTTTPTLESQCMKGKEGDCPEAPIILLSSGPSSVISSENNQNDGREQGDKKSSDTSTNREPSSDENQTDDNETMVDGRSNVATRITRSRQESGTKKSFDSPSDGNQIHIEPRRTRSRQKENPSRSSDNHNNEEGINKVDDVGDKRSDNSIDEESSGDEGRIRSEVRVTRSRQKEKLGSPYNENQIHNETRVTRIQPKEKARANLDTCNDSNVLSDNDKEENRHVKQKQGRDEENDVRDSLAENESNSVESNNECKISTEGADKTFLRKTLVSLLKQVRRRVDQFGFFSGKVDHIADDLPGYYDIIDAEKEAMDLDTMEDLIIEGKICGINDFECYLKRIVHCAKKYYNNKDDQVQKEAEKIEELAQPVIDQAYRKIQRHVEMRESQSSEQNTTDFRRSTRSRKRARNSGQDDHQSPLQKRRSPRSASQPHKNEAKKSNESDYVAQSDVNDDSDSSTHHESSSTSTYSLDNRSSLETADLESQGSLRETRSRSVTENSRVSSLRSHTCTKAERKDDSKRKPPSTRKSPRTPKKKNINYSEAVSNESESDEESQKTSADHSKDDSQEDYEGDIPGSDIPQCARDLSKSDMTHTSSREELLSLIPDMLLVCNEAARRAALKVDPDAESYDKPLSEVYMTEILEYHDPLSGFLIKMKGEPHYLQGFIVTTNFKTWNKTFRWAIDVPAAGITPTDHRVHNVDDGTLTAELQNVKRSGNCSRKGIGFHRVAEISLVGGLGCGGILLSKALSELRQSGEYDYVVLQSTKMAIRFYERHGFVRVGAITTFRDNAMMPEVAYRHWSEIVDGEALEPSYMMALRLKTTKSPTSRYATPQTPKHDTKVSRGERMDEIKSALKSVFSVLVEALTIRATGSQIYSASFREMMLNAHIFARSAEDDAMVRTMDKALAAHSDNSASWSKNVIRDELKIPRPKEIRQQVSPDVAAKLFPSPKPSIATPNTSFSVESETESTALMQSQISKSKDAPCSQLKHIRVTVKSEHERTRHLEAEVPPSIFTSGQDENEDNIDGWICRNVAVSIIVDGSSFLDDSTLLSSDRKCRHNPNDEFNSLQNLDAQLPMPTFQGSLNDLKEAARSALENLKGSCRDYEISSERPAVRPGDSIMLKVDGYDGSPLWVSVTVEKHCTKRDRPPGGKHFNSYVITYEEGGTSYRIFRVLDSNNQGVGRDWCTNADWSSFALLPANVLDAILIGSWVEYPDSSGKTVQGRISRRVGGGLSSVPKWRLVLSSTASGTNKDAISLIEELASKDFTAGELREAVSVNDENMKRTAKLVNEMDLLPSSTQVSNPRLLSPLNGKPKEDKSSPIETIRARVTPKESSNLKERNSQRDPSFSDLTEAEIDKAADEWATCRMKVYKLGSR